MHGCSYVWHSLDDPHHTCHCNTALRATYHQLEAPAPCVGCFCCRMLCTPEARAPSTYWAWLSLSPLASLPLTHVCSSKRIPVPRGSQGDTSHWPLEACQLRAVPHPTVATGWEVGRACIDHRCPSQCDVASLAGAHCCRSSTYQA